MKDTKEKKIGRSFSLKDSELARIESRASKHGFSDRNEYLLALVEVDEALDLEPQLADSKQRILRPGFSSPYSNRERLLASSIGAIGKMLKELTNDTMNREGRSVPVPANPAIQAGVSAATGKPLVGQKRSATSA